MSVIGAERSNGEFHNCPRLFKAVFKHCDAIHHVYAESLGFVEYHSLVLRIIYHAFQGPCLVVLHAVDLPHCRAAVGGILFL